MLQFEAERAWQFYEEGVALVPLIDRDSRAALWALARIYNGLLARIDQRGYDVFSAHVRLTTPEKMKILFRAGLGGWSEKNVLEERHRHRRRAGGPLLRRRAG
jgi:phytoene synthase